MAKNIFRFIGFFLFIFGMLSFVFLLTGINFTFLTWVDSFGGLTGLIIRICMICLGLLISYATSIKTEE